MKTLITRLFEKKWDTAAYSIYLNRDLRRNKSNNTYFCNIKPCVDCRYCWTRPTCSINDDMQNVILMINEADNIVIASPLYFFRNCSGALLNMLSRCNICIYQNTL